MSALESRKPGAVVPKPAPMNEWGVYDPSVAGIAALFARLYPANAPTEPISRRRARRSAAARKKPADTNGVGLAIAEAIARAEKKQGRHVADTPRLAVEARRERRAPTAMWMRAVSVAHASESRDDILGIFADLRIPAPVALVQYARGCRIGRIRIVEP
jgi:hypothetical protein